MEILEIYKNHHQVSLQELYERAHIRYLAKHWRSSALFICLQPPQNSIKSGKGGN